MSPARASPTFNRPNLDRQTSICASVASIRLATSLVSPLTRGTLIKLVLAAGRAHFDISPSLDNF